MTRTSAAIINASLQQPKRRPGLLGSWSQDNKIISLYFENERLTAQVTDYEKNQEFEIENEDIIGLSPQKLSGNLSHISRLFSEFRVNVSELNDNSRKLHINPKMQGGANIIDPSQRPDRLWVGGIIPITVDCLSFGATEIDKIVSAINDWAQNTTFHFEVYLKNLENSNIAYHYNTANMPITYSQTFNGRFAVYKNNLEYLVTEILPNEPYYEDHVLIQKYTPECKMQQDRETSAGCNVCQSNVGCMGGQQLISCKLGESFNEAALKHELGHAIGFYHEQQRFDRDSYVAILSKIPKGDPNYSIFYDIFSRVDFGPYDLQSIMHYYLGRATLGQQEVDMRLKNTQQAEQYEQLLELGNFQIVKVTNSNFALFEKMPRSTMIPAGVEKVGNTGVLSQVDIAAANFLASQGRKLGG